MKQTLHIFKKDTRRFWIEIVATLAIEALVVIFFPDSWQKLNTNTMAQRLPILVPFALWLLIARVIHAEVLVGENQFWTTRPYEWKKLLAAKALFLAVWVYLPYLLMQSMLLIEAGFSPRGHAVEWLYLLLGVTAAIVVPLVALSAVTSSFARMTIVFLGGLVGAVAFSSVLSHLVSYESNVPYEHHGLILGIIVCGGCAVAILQYWSRRTQLARGLLAGVVLVCLGAVVAIAATRSRQIDNLYPMPLGSTDGHVHLAFAPDAKHPVKLESSERPDYVYINVPIQFSGIAAGSAVQLDDVKFSIDAPGLRWTAPWWTSNGRYLPGQYTSEVQIMLPRKTFEQVGATSVTLNMQLAVTELKVDEQTTVAIKDGDFAVNGLGICSHRLPNHRQGLIVCRSAFGPPPLTRMTTVWSAAPCDGSQPVPAARPTGADWVGKAYSDPVISGGPVVSFDFVQPYPRDAKGHELESTEGLAICPGTPLYFTRYAVSGRSQASVAIPNFVLPKER